MRPKKVLPEWHIIQSENYKTREEFGNEANYSFPFHSNSQRERGQFFVLAVFQDLKTHHPQLRSIEDRQGMKTDQT